MKRVLQLLSMLFIMHIVTNVAIAQEAMKQVNIIIDNPGSKEAFIDKTKKTLDLALQGLEDQTSADAFEARIKSFEGVKSFQMSKSVVNGLRKAHIEFIETYPESYFEKLLVHSEARTLILNGEKTPISRYKKRNSN